MKDRILKWFDILQFPTEWKTATIEAINTFDLAEIEKQEKPYAWLLEQENKMTGMLYALYKCEDFFNQGIQKGIPEEILVATLQEIRRHSQNYNRATKGEKIGLRQIKWAEVILSGRLYCLGRLEFEMKTIQKTWENGGITTPGAKVLSVHIPRTGGPLLDEEAEESFKMSKVFFKKYFHDFDYKCYFCHSWLLDPTLRKLLKPDSNIVKFLDRFDVTETNESESGLRIIFGGDTTYENVLEKTPQTGLQKSAYEYIKNGGKLLEGFGFIEK